jgi:hypothetical protein
VRKGRTIIDGLFLAVLHVVDMREQGRGFAVVAAEVRTLAQRSAAAAKEINSLIDDSVEKVNAHA